MLQALTAFTAQFALVFLLGFQTANIRDSAYHLVFLTSLAIGVAELGVISSVVRGVVMGAGPWYVYAAFLLGGAAGVLCSLYLADYLRKRRG